MPNWIYSKYGIGDEAPVNSAYQAPMSGSPSRYAAPPYTTLYGADIGPAVVHYGAGFGEYPTPAKPDLLPPGVTIYGQQFEDPQVHRMREGANAFDVLKEMAKTIESLRKTIEEKDKQIRWMASEITLLRNSVGKQKSRVKRKRQSKDSRVLEKCLRESSKLTGKED